MATEVIAFPVNLRKNVNRNSKANGHYYPEADRRAPLNLKGFARHLSEHGKLVDYPMAVLVLQNIVNCMKEMLVQGQPICLDGCGTFTPIIESTGFVADNTTVEATMANGLDAVIAGVHIRFKPTNVKGEELTSRALKKACVFRAAYVVETKYKTIDGKQKSYQEKIPISTYDIATSPDNP